ncbi:MAG: tRNA dimethylallyltransferase [Gemmatimonadetes bacterium]|nr:tRNA dimethylallyltransferase [Gemmatimonadota bacterium]
MTTHGELASSGEAQEVRVICGPTGAGKTRVALALVEQVALTVISADSRQLYRRFDVGTAKPSDAERAVAPHLGVDVLDPVERASAAWWADRADGWIRETFAAGRTPVVVGGTGLYLRALFDALFDEPPLDAERRAALHRELAPLDTDELRRWVIELDPARATLGRTQLLRAVEIALLTGHRVSHLHRERARPPRWRARYLVVDPGDELAPQIAMRTTEMFARGWRAEVRALMRDVPDDAPAWNATGYRTVRLLERGGLSHDNALEKVIIETRQYAKRQRTWFRHQLPAARVTRLDPRDPDCARRALAWWSECAE